MKNVIVGLGELLWDIFPDRNVIGGAPSNFAFHASQLGCDACVVSAVGKDSLGDDILQYLKEKEVTYLVEQIDYPTGSVKVSLNKVGIPTYNIIENVAWDNIPFTPQLEELAKQTSAVCFGTLAQRNPVTRTTTQRFLANLPIGSLKVFDINIRQNFYTKENIITCLNLANVLKLNEDEIRLVSDMLDLAKDNEQDACVALLKQYDLDLVILTKGGEDSYAFTNKETSYQSTPQLRIADTVGAGDSFTAAFVAAYMNNYRLVDAHRLAVEVSAYVCTQYGAMPTLPDAYRNMFK